MERAVTVCAARSMATTSSSTPDVEAEPLEQRAGRLEGEVLLLLDHPAYVIRQPAVGERDVPGPLQHHDAGLGVETAQARGGGHPAGDSADDDNTLRHGPTT